mmetsp:Transcript_93694/g.201040  ORF Transcript_93694/g.201040 Transcript_93694/m.201040 type:complete len:212 (-) Transcript_93694:2189-2824(-)
MHFQQRPIAIHMRLQERAIHVANRRIHMHCNQAYPLDTLLEHPCGAYHRSYTPTILQSFAEIQHRRIATWHQQYAMISHIDFLSDIINHVQHGTPFSALIRHFFPRTCYGGNCFAEIVTQWCILIRSLIYLMSTCLHGCANEICSMVTQTLRNCLCLNLMANFFWRKLHLMTRHGLHCLLAVYVHAQPTRTCALLDKPCGSMHDVCNFSRG